MSTAESASVPAPDPAPTAAASTDARPEAQHAPSTSSSGGKSCSLCHRTLPNSGFSGKQLKLPAHSRKCMECVVKASAAPTASTNGSADHASPATTSPSQQAVDSNPSSKSNGKNKGKSKEKQQPASAATATKSKAKKKASGNGSGSDKAELLLEDESWFSPLAERALIEVFRRFDVDGDGGWTLTDIQKFATATNGKPFTTEELIEIQENLQHDDQGRLTEQGFLDFYHLQSTSHPDETWKDLKKLGYTAELTLPPEFAATLTYARGPAAPALPSPSASTAAASLANLPDWQHFLVVAKSSLKTDLGSLALSKDVAPLLQGVLLSVDMAIAFPKERETYLKRMSEGLSALTKKHPDSAQRFTTFAQQVHEAFAKVPKA